MSKKIPLTVLSGMLATLTPTAEAKISRCEDDQGHVTFSDSGCDRVLTGPHQDNIDPSSIFPLAGEEKNQHQGKVFFYCRSGTKKYTKC